VPSSTTRHAFAAASAALAAGLGGYVLLRLWLARFGRYWVPEFTGLLAIFGSLLALGSLAWFLAGAHGGALSARGLVRRATAGALALAFAVYALSFEAGSHPAEVYVLAPWVGPAVALAALLAAALASRNAGATGPDADRAQTATGCVILLALAHGLLWPAGHAHAGFPAEQLWLALQTGALCAWPLLVWLNVVLWDALAPSAGGGATQRRTSPWQLLLPGPHLALFALPGAPWFEPVMLGGLLLGLGSVARHATRVGWRTIAAGFAVVLVFYAPVLRGSTTLAESTALAALAALGWLVAERILARRPLGSTPAALLAISGRLLAFTAAGLLAAPLLFQWLGTPTWELAAMGGWLAALAGLAVASVLAARAFGALEAGLLAAALAVVPVLSEIVPPLPPATEVPATQAGVRVRLADGRVLAAQEIPRNEWLEVQTAGDPYRRRIHGGAVYDDRQRALVLFGTETHGWYFDGPVHRFWLDSQTFSEDRPPPLPYTYHVRDDGFRVAGFRGDHPWAMHACSALAFDPGRAGLVVAGAPLHNPVPVAGRARDATWLYEPDLRRWTPIAAEGPSVPVPCDGALVHDVLRDTLVAYRPLVPARLALPVVGDEAERAGVWELGPERRAWREVLAQPLHEGGVAAVFDRSLPGVVLFAGGGAPPVVHYVVDAEGPRLLVPEPQIDPPCQHQRVYPPPTVAYGGQPGRTLVLAHQGELVHTCVYDSGRARLAWLGGFPLSRLGQNHMLVYASAWEAFVLISGRGDRARVWLFAPD
jgi:hypothetical protein